MHFDATSAVTLLVGQKGQLVCKIALIIVNGSPLETQANLE